MVFLTRMPLATPTNIASWIITGTVFNYFVFFSKKKWWKRYNYVLSVALEDSTTFMGVLLYFAVGMENRYLGWWGIDLDHCPLDFYPNSSGIVVKGCPVF